jgi:hypothetical protein
VNAGVRPMRLTLMLLAACFVGCATRTVELTEEQILARAKACSKPFCSAFPEGCEFKVWRYGQQWHVNANPIERDDKGERSYPFHSDCTFVFSLEGAPLEEIQWPWLNSAKGCGGRETPTASCPLR